MKTWTGTTRHRRGVSGVRYKCMMIQFWRSFETKVAMRI